MALTTMPTRDFHLGFIDRHALSTAAGQVLPAHIAAGARRGNFLGDRGRLHPSRKMVYRRIQVGETCLPRRPLTFLETASVLQLYRYR